MSTTLLISAIKEGDITTVKKLLEHGNNPNDPDNFGMTALHYAAFSPHGEEMVNLLLQFGASVNAASSTGITPLMHADSYIIAKTLIDHGALVNAKTEEGSTALHAYANRCIVPVIQLLLDHGALVNEKIAISEITPLMFAAENDSADAIKAVELLIAHGADIHAVDRDGLTAVDYAIRVGNKEIALFLKQKERARL